MWLEQKLLLIFINLWCQLSIFILGSKVALNEVIGLLIDLLVLVRLEELYLVQSCKKNDQPLHYEVKKKQKQNKT